MSEAGAFLSLAAFALLAGFAGGAGFAVVFARMVDRALRRRLAELDWRTAMREGEARG